MNLTGYLVPPDDVTVTDELGGVEDPLYGEAHPPVASVTPTRTVANIVHRDVTVISNASQRGIGIPLPP